jgi:hypothetical protein
VRRQFDRHRPTRRRGHWQDGAQRDGRTAADRDFLQLVLRKEGDPLAVRRKDRRGRTASAGQLDGRRLIEATREETALRDEYQPVALGRDDHARAGIRAELHARTKVDVQTHQRLRLAGGGPTHAPPASESHRRHHQRHTGDDEGLARVKRSPLRVRRLVDQSPGVADVAEPLSRILLETPSDEFAEARRHACEIRRVFEDGGNGFGGCVGLNQPPAGEHLVQHAAEGPDIGALVDSLSPRLLGRHVGGGSEQHAGLRDRRRRDGRDV